MGSITKTKAAILVELNQSLEIVDLELPVLRKGEVLVKVHSAGLCHTQLLEIKGENASGAHNPNLLGHEGSGIVCDVGETVRKVKKGDHVVLSWIKGSGANVCPEPLEQNGKLINRGPVTTFSEYTVVSENRVTPIPKTIPLKPAALLGCAVPTGMGMINNSAQVTSQDIVMIIGCGGIGINAIHGASLAGAAKIIAVDVNEYKLSEAKKFGATDVIDPTQENLEKRVRDITEGDGVGVAIDTVGRRETMETAYGLTNNHRGRTILCGVPNPPNMKINIDPFPLYYGKRLLGTGGGESDPDVDFSRYAQLYSDGTLNLDEMITHEFKLAEINKGFEILKSGRGLRVVISME